MMVQSAACDKVPARAPSPALEPVFRMHKVPRLLRFIAVAALGMAALFSIARLAFWLVFSDPADPVPGADLLFAFYLGAKYDLRLALVLLLPLAVLAGLPWLDPFRHRPARLGWTGYLAAAFALVALFYAVDFGHYAYLRSRIDITVLRFLENADISATMVWESYPVVWIGLGLGLLVAAAAVTGHALFGRIAAQPAAGLRWRGRTLAGVLGALVILFGIYGKVSWYPLRWSDAYFSPHGFAAAVAVNPIHYFLDTRKNGGIRYDEKKVRAHYDEVADLLGVDRPDRNRLDFLRTVAPPAAAKRHNVVIVQIESFAGYKTSLSGNPVDPTPHFAELARGGLHFDNFFVPHTGTARAVFATTTGIPDVETSGTSSRNPVIVNQHTIIDDFTDYERFYFLGGSASWGNIRGLLSHNIAGLNLYEEGSYQSPRVDVWGISDLALFDEANQILRSREKPFIAYIQTSGGHRPYTIPDDNRGFESTSPALEVRDYGFDDESEFNSFRFMDHAIGWFMEAARREPYFDNTIFVFFGDHGLKGNTGRHTPASETQLELGMYRVPLVIYAPGLIREPAVNSAVGSQVDILPTVARLAGQPYRNAAMGRDLLDPRLDEGDRRYAFTINHSSRTVALVADDFLLRMNYDGSDTHLFRLGEADSRRDVGAEHPERKEKMRRLTEGLYETAKYMLYHNPRGE